MGCTWKLAILLSFGVLYYWNRNLEEESKWERIKRNIKTWEKGHSLREAVFQKRVTNITVVLLNEKELEIPPIYDNMKITGLI